MDKGETISCLECKIMEVKPTECMKNDVPFLPDEKFDFDLSFSPTSETEDEVFVGPVGHKEKCIATSLEAYKKTSDENLPAVDKLTWSPLAGEKFVEVFKEAHIIALQLQSGSKTKRNNSGQLEDQKAEIVEKFVQESKSKLKILEKGIMVEKTPKAVKRETYCVGQSPVCDLPPSSLKHSRQPIIAKQNFNSPQRTRSAPSPGRTDKLPQTSIMTLAQERSTKSKKTSLIRVVRNSSVFGNSSYLSVEQSKQGKLFSASSRNSLNSTGSSEDLLSDKSSIASDAGDLSSSNSSSLQGKRTLPTPSKLGMAAQLKPPSKIHMRKNTSTSSSSHSSMNSSLNTSLSISPKNGRAKTIVASKVPSNNFRPSSSTSKISLVKPMKRLSMQIPHSDASGRQQRSTSVTKGNPSGNELQNRGTLRSESLASGIRMESSDPILQKKSISGSVRSMSSPRSQIKTATPVSKKGVHNENVAAKVLQPLALSSCGKVVSNIAVTPPFKQTEDGLELNSCPPVKSVLRTPASTKFSALPTPIGRRISGIPGLTPQSMPRSMPSTKLVPCRQFSSISSKKTVIASSKLTRNTKSWMTSSSSSTEDLSPPQVVPTVLDFSPEKFSLEVEEREKPTEETQVKESLLIDIGIDEAPVAIQECENKPLIDLNTPEMVKVPLLKPVGQLIDLNFPLIDLSPEGNKENLDSPLLKF